MYKSYVAIAPHPEEFPKLLDRMARTCASRTTGRRTSTDDAGDAHLRRQRHVPAGARREVLPVARRRTEGRRLAARAHIAESPGDSAEPHALRNGPRTAVGRCRSAVPERPRPRKELGRAGGREVNPTA